MTAVAHYELPEDARMRLLYERILRTLRAVPTFFSSTINIEGLSATDLFSMNSLLGGAIESQTVAALNNMRSIWDPDGNLIEYSFVRYPESFPDVRLEREDREPLIGIELKGWYLLAKEEMPSFRFVASADAMTVWDLLVVFPWSLSNVISGTPVLGAPFIEQAKYLADLRTYYWEHRSPNAEPVVHPETHPYPDPRSAYSDQVTDDRGKNFGRIARVRGLMDGWIEESLNTPLAGIEAKWWVKFLKLFDEKGDSAIIRSKFEKLAKETGHDEAWCDEVIECVTLLMDL